MNVAGPSFNPEPTATESVAYTVAVGCGLNNRYSPSNKILREHQPHTDSTRGVPACRPRRGRGAQGRVRARTSLVDHPLTEINSWGVVASDFRINMAFGRWTLRSVSCFGHTPNAPDLLLL